MEISQGLPIAVALALAVVLSWLRSRWTNSHWRNEQLKPVNEIDELVRIVAGLQRRATKRNDSEGTTITSWVQPFLPMIDQWRVLRQQLRKKASFGAWLRLGMPEQLIPDHRSATLQLHARSAVAPILARFNAGPVVLEPSLGDDLWRALSVDLPDVVVNPVGIPRLSQS